jgi:predicted secreted protein
MVRINDKRSMKIVVASHCVLNQNAKLEGIAGWPGAIKEVADLILSSGAGILQMPCPEMIYEGIGRFDKSVEQYDCPAFRDLCQKITIEIVDQIENYMQWGYTVSAILAIDGSPSCGFNLTQSAPEWRGLVAGMQWQKVRYEHRAGILMKYLSAELKLRQLDIPILGIPEIPELGDLDGLLIDLKQALTDPHAGGES